MDIYKLTYAMSRKCH